MAQTSSRSIMKAEKNARSKLFGLAVRRVRSLTIAVTCGVVSLLLVSVAQAALPIQHWQTEKGAKVYFVENHDLPLLDINVDFVAGSSRDDPAKSGAASLVLHMLDLGAAGLSDDEISRSIADVGAELGGHFDRDRAGVSLRTLSAERERKQSLGILAKVLQQPDFPQPILEREKARIIAALKEAETQPASIGDKAFYAALYGNHPYALQPSGEVATVSLLTRDDLTAFYRANYTAGSAVIALMGDISRAEAEAIARQVSDSLPPSTAAKVQPDVLGLTAEVDKYIPHPASQSHILMGEPGVRRGDPDYFPLLVGNYVLGGGGFDSRLTNEVREKRGLAYSASSYFMPMSQEGPFQIGLQTKKEQTDEAVKIVRNVLKDFIAKGPAAAELKQAKNNLMGGFPLRIDSNKKILEYLSVIGFYGLPLTYLDDFVGNVEKVSLEKIKQAFARHVHPDRMVLVVVGGGKQADKVEQPVK